MEQAIAYDIGVTTKLTVDLEGVARELEAPLATVAVNPDAGGRP